MNLFVFEFRPETMSVGVVLPQLPIAIDCWRRANNIRAYFLTHMHGGTSVLAVSNSVQKTAITDGASCRSLQRTDADVEFRSHLLHLRVECIAARQVSALGRHHHHRGHWRGECHLACPLHTHTHTHTHFVLSSSRWYCIWMMPKRSWHVYGATGYIRLADTAHLTTGHCTAC